VVDRIAFEPRLPGTKLDALGAVRYGHAAKLFVPLSAPAPAGAVMNVSERYWCWTQTGADGAAMPAVSCFAGSAAALEELGVAEGPPRWLESLARLRPDLELEPDRAVLSTWDDDPWVRAAYSISPGPGLAEALIEPSGPLAFAGEHAGGRFNGLMEGAIRSGREAARRLLAS
jgi:monoamine oxidase